MYLLDAIIFNCNNKSTRVECAVDNYTTRLQSQEDFALLSAFVICPPCTETSPDWQGKGGLILQYLNLAQQRISMHHVYITMIHVRVKQSAARSCAQLRAAACSCKFNVATRCDVSGFTKRLGPIWGQAHVFE
jgi:hypothetical protein